MPVRAPAALAAFILLSGCGAVIFKTYEMEGAKPVAISMDAKQRLAFVLPRDASPSASVDGKRRPPTSRIVCAEPSPDTMVGVAASLGLDVPFSGGSVGLETSMAQAVAQIGNRTQTIALLRDGLYRACEAYMNGIMGEQEYELLLRHYDMTMVMLVALDGLTRACPPQAGISTSSSTTQQGGDGAAAKVTDAPDAAKAGDGKAGDGKAADGKVADAKKPATAKTSTAANANVTTTESSSTCGVSKEAAAEVGAIVRAFFAYKEPMHVQACVRDLIPRLVGEKNADPRAFEAALSVAQRACAVPPARVSAK